MSVVEHKILAVQDAMKYFAELKDTSDSLVFQMETFGNPERVYLLTGNISIFKTNLKRMSLLMQRINSDLLKDGICIIEPNDNDNNRTSLGKQTKVTKRRKKTLV